MREPNEYKDSDNYFKDEIKMTDNDYQKENAENYESELEEK